MSSGGDFWTRRKAGVREEEQAVARAREAQDRAAREAEFDGKSDVAICEDLGLPDPDALSPGDDFAAFMAKAVPERIRRRALRRLWLSNPALANLDGLLEYGEDYTDSATVIESLQTAYQVGKGMVARAGEMVRGMEPVDADVPADGTGDVIATTEPESPAQAMVAAEPVDRMPPDAPEAEIAAPPPRRRMRFTFADRARGET